MESQLHNFYFGGLVVGYFEDDRYPLGDGEYRYEAYRGLGHYDLVTALNVGKVVECYFDVGAARVQFRVLRLAASNILQCANFRRCPIPPA